MKFNTEKAAWDYWLFSHYRLDIRAFNDWVTANKVEWEYDDIADWMEHKYSEDNI